jgi:2-keto-4-pentenoate hydratase
MSESQLDSLYAELNKAEQQRNAILDIQGDYPDVKVPKALTARINELNTTIREMKAKYPDFAYPAIVG